MGKDKAQTDNKTVTKTNPAKAQIVVADDQETVIVSKDLLSGKKVLVNNFIYRTIGLKLLMLGNSIVVKMM